MKRPGVLNSVYYAYYVAAQAALEGIPSEQVERDLFAALRSIMDAGE